MTSFKINKPDFRKFICDIIINMIEENYDLISFNTRINFKYQSFFWSDNFIELKLYKNYNIGIVLDNKEELFEYPKYNLNLIIEKLDKILFPHRFETLSCNIEKTLEGLKYYNGSILDNEQFIVDPDIFNILEKFLLKLRKEKIRDPYLFLSNYNTIIIEYNDDMYFDLLNDSTMNFNKKPFSQEDIIMIIKDYLK